MVHEGLIVIIDLKKDHVAVGFECAKVVLFMRVVGVAEIVIDGNCFDDASDRLGAEGWRRRKLAQLCLR